MHRSQVTGEPSQFVDDEIEFTSAEAETATAALQEGLQRAKRMVRETGEMLKEQHQILGQILAD